ncbi:MAG: TatD family hydrolase [Armatimonadota bacterium]|nr:TatD family hydrolase [Armatimonadota bacterium]
MFRLIDTHAHLNHEDFDHDLERVIERAAQEGVERIIVPGYDLPSSRRAVELAGRFEGIYAAVGVHPHDAKTLDAATFAEIRALAGAGGVVAIGEIGLDFHYDLSPRQVQIEAFRAQAALAIELNLPLIVHTREAAEEVLAVLRQTGVGHAAGVMHHFSGGEQFARAAMEMGFILGIAGPVTYKKNDELRETVRRVGLNALVVETDSPYAAPQPVRGKRNEPGYVTRVAARIAEELGLGIEGVAATTTANAEKLFRLR